MRLKFQGEKLSTTLVMGESACHDKTPPSHKNEHSKENHAPANSEQEQKKGKRKQCPPADSAPEHVGGNSSRDKETVEVPAALENEPSPSPADQTAALTNSNPKKKGRPPKNAATSGKPKASAKRRAAKAKAKSKAAAKARPAKTTKSNTRKRKVDMEDEGDDDASQEQEESDQEIPNDESAQDETLEYEVEAEVGAEVEPEGGAEVEPARSSKPRKNAAKNDKQLPTKKTAAKALKGKAKEEHKSGTDETDETDVKPKKRAAAKAKSKTSKAKAANAKNPRSKAKAKDEGQEEVSKTKGKKRNAVTSEAGDGEAERKAMLSRKSCAYKKARGEALRAGKSLEEAKIAAKAAT